MLFSLHVLKVDLKALIFYDLLTHYSNQAPANGTDVVVGTPQEEAGRNTGRRDGTGQNGADRRFPASFEAL